MADEYYSRVDYEFEGDSIFTIPFEYIKKEYISVYIDGVQTTEFEFLNDSQIQVNVDLSGVQTVEIVRTTPIDSKIVTYTNTSILKADNLNLSQDQVFQAVQELYDNCTILRSDMEAAIRTGFEQIIAYVDEELGTVKDAADLINEIRDVVLRAEQVSQEAAEQALDAAEKAIAAMELTLAYGITYEIIDDNVDLSITGERIGGVNYIDLGDL